MKKLMTAALALTLAAGSAAGAAQAAPRHDDHRNDHRYEQRHTPPKAVKKTVVVKHWKRGERLPAQYRAAHYRIATPARYHLHQAPHGYQWSRVGNDAVLIAVASGLIGAVVANAFN